MKRFKGITEGVQFKGVMKYSDIVEMQNKVIEAIQTNDGALCIHSGMNTSVSSTGLVITEGILLWGGFPATFEGESGVSRTNKKYFVITRVSQDQRIGEIEGQTYNYYAYDYYQAETVEQFYTTGSTYSGKEVVGCIPFIFRCDDYPAVMVVTDNVDYAEGDIVDYANGKGYVLVAGDTKYIQTSGVLFGDEALAISLGGYYDNGLVYFGDTLNVGTTFIQYEAASVVAEVPNNDRLVNILAQIKCNLDSIKNIAYTSDYSDLENKLEDVSDLAAYLTDETSTYIPNNGTVSSLLSIMRNAVNAFERVASTGNYLDLIGYPYKLSQLENDAFPEVQSEVRILASADDIPDGWQAADGTNGTLNLAGLTLNNVAVTAIQRPVVSMFTLTLTSTGGKVGITPIVGDSEFSKSLRAGNVTVYFAATYPNLFRGWFENQEGSMVRVSDENPYTFDLQADRTFEAQVLAQYKITYSIDSPLPTIGSIAISAENPTWLRYVEVVTASGAVLLAQPPADATYEFVGYRIDGVLQEYDTYANGFYSKTVSPTADMVVEAVYMEVTNVVVDVQPAGSGTVSINPLPPYAAGNVIKISAVANGINRFAYFEYGASQSQVNPLTYAVSQGRNELVARFIRVYRLEVRTEDMTTERGQVQIDSSALAAEASANIDEGTESILNAVPSDGWSFNSWVSSRNVSSFSNPLSVSPTEDITYTARFSRNYYIVTVTANPIEYGVVSGGGTYEHGSECNLVATPSQGRHFVEWRKYTSDFDYTVLSTLSEFAFEVLERSVIEGVFALNQYTIQVTAAEGGTVTGGGTYDYGTSATLVAEPNLYWLFDGFYENDIRYSTQIRYQFIVNRDRNIQARFIREQATITIVQDPENTTVVNGAGTFDRGSQRTLSYQKVEGIEFLGWYEGNTLLSTTDELTFNLVRDITVTARFNVLQYEIIATSSSESRGTVSGGGRYTYGQMATVRATPLQGNVFVNWTEAGQEVSRNSVFTFEVTGARNLVANFSPLSCSVLAVSENPEQGSTLGSGSFPYNSQVTVVAQPAQGYVFLEWLQNGVQVSTDATYTFTVVNDTELIARFVSE